MLSKRTYAMNARHRMHDSADTITALRATQCSFGSPQSVSRLRFAFRRHQESACCSRVRGVEASCEKRMPHTSFPAAM